MFADYSHLLLDNAPRLHYGIAVTDVDGDGAWEAFVTGFGGPNVVLKWDGAGFVNIAPNELGDIGRQAIGVAAGDFDGDGKEEIYVLNTDTFAGSKRYGDRLFRLEDGRWEDLFSRPESQSAMNLTAGRSVAVVDRNGTGTYGFYVANYGGPVRFYEYDQESHGVVDRAAEAGLDRVAGGRSVVSLPLLTSRMDIFAANENGPNFLFRNLGDGMFREMAAEAGLSDPDEHGRGIAVLDANGDGKFDLVCGNWEGPHRLFLRGEGERFETAAPRLMAIPSRIRTVIAADFDNCGYEELFFNNIGQPNRLFAFRDGVWAAVDTGAAWEPEGLGTGAVAADLDGDGRLELLIAHGESGSQPLSLFKAEPNGNHFLRIRPLTRAGAPARGAVVRLHGSHRRQLRAICAGSGYLCQMEPVAHFGLGSTPDVEQVEIQWPDGAQSVLAAPAIDREHIVPHPES